MDAKASRIDLKPSSWKRDKIRKKSRNDGKIKANTHELERRQAEES